MKYIGALFYNFEAFQDTAIIVISQEKTPNRIVSNEGVVGLYFNDELIGINIFDFNRFIKMRLLGLLEEPSKKLQDLIKSLSKNYLNEDVELATSLIKEAIVISKSKDTYLIQDNEENTYQSKTFFESHEIGSHVLFLLKDSFLDTGEKVDSYLKDEEALIIGEELK